jgi:hypothetical protein
LSRVSIALFLMAASVSIATTKATAATPTAAADESTAGPLAQELITKYGADQKERIERGIAAARTRWRAEDGDANAFAEMVRTQYAGDAKLRDALFDRLEFVLESTQGHFHEIGRDLRRQSDLDLGTVFPFDELMSAWDVGAHFTDDWFQNRLAFVVLLNFPPTPLAEQLSEGAHWSRRRWAEERLGDLFEDRVPANVSQAIQKTYSESELYIANYNIWAHHLLDADGKRIFPSGLRLLSHWNIRDEIRADYADAKDGLAKQRMLSAVLEHIVTQQIPAAVVDNPGVDWKVSTNEVTASSEHDGDGSSHAKPSNEVENDTRYARLLANFRAQSAADPFSPEHPTLIARSFEEGRQIPEARVQAMFEQILSSAPVAEVAALIQKRLGRPLEPFDIWYAGFRPRAAHPEAELDALCRKRYPTAMAYQKDVPRLLKQLGFSADKARYVADHLIVDPARGSGHAMQAERREDKVHLRTRVEPGGMNYKGYNIAVHEMGHNVEQVFSLQEIDYWSLRSVPNNAFTEALAFTFQDRDLELLGLAKPDAKSRALRDLDQFWGAYEIAGVGLVDMGVWHWMYAHPDATPAQLRMATVQIAKDVWNRFYAPIFGVRDVVLLAVYSHMINEFLYLPDYGIGHMIAFQIEQHMDKATSFGAEFERIAKSGDIAPDLWMQNAVGAPVGPESLITRAHEAVQLAGP